MDSCDDATVSTSNKSQRALSPFVATPATAHTPSKFKIALTHAIADTGATSIYIMEGTEVANRRKAPSPLTINLADGIQVQSSDVCDFHIPGLPVLLAGHIVPALNVASLIGIRPLCKAGCIVIFDDAKCDVTYNGKVILRGFKDRYTDLWTLPIPTPTQIVGKGDATQMHPVTDVAMFMHSVCTRSNAVKFAHQSLCNPRISTLLKALRRGFLKGCPNMTESLVLHYLNPSPATSKGHMKRPRQGIQSTRLHSARTAPNSGIMPKPPVLPMFVSPGDSAHPTSPHVLDADVGGDTANIFCFGAFADKTSGIVYHDLTGSFPFMLYDGSVCFFVLYHYESNAILATPIAGLNDVSIFSAYAYKKYFVELTS